MPVDTAKKPPLREWFIETHFFPLRKNRPDLSMDEVLIIALEQVPFQVNMSSRTLYRYLHKMAKGSSSKTYDP